MTLCAGLRGIALPYDAILYMHISDNRGIHDDHLPSGRGAVDLAGAPGAARRLQQPVGVAIECRLWLAREPGNQPFVSGRRC